MLVLVYSVWQQINIRLSLDWNVLLNSQRIVNDIYY